MNRITSMKIRKIMRILTREVVVPKRYLLMKKIVIAPTRDAMMSPSMLILAMKLREIKSSISFLMSVKMVSTPLQIK